MKLATYIDQLTAAGIEPKIATAHAKAIETMLDDKYVTKDYLDAKLSELTTKLYQALLVQTVGIAGLILAILKLAPH
ncbi:hypothetical protein [Hyphomicrobium sp. ghe19]|uniref:hypothetical protein n=1 Tax=Hyphomicrobium sp. ghe19 TaxID=2682968 RepID=UPI0013677840|nr:hypothetical protein HYPP_02439 [Hyphomicrobium sp. ghe19]